MRATAPDALIGKRWSSATQAMTARLTATRAAGPVSRAATLAESLSKSEPTTARLKPTASPSRATWKGRWAVTHAIRARPSSRFTVAGPMK